MEDAIEDVFFLCVSDLCFSIYSLLCDQNPSSQSTDHLWSQAILELVLISLQGLIVASCNFNHLSSKELSH